MKFKVGDHVRVTISLTKYFDQVGAVQDVVPDAQLPFGISGLESVPVWFGPDELILAEPDPVNHPSHYGGEDDPYEAIKVIEAWGLGFHLGNTVKYIARAGKKSGQSLLQDLRKARWYIDRLIKKLEASE